MKKISILVIAIFFVFVIVAGKSLALEMEGEYDMQQTQEMRSITDAPAETQTKHIHRTSEFIGQGVKDQQGEEIGEINDVVFDKEGNISYMILSKEGEEGVLDVVDSELIPIPWQEDKISIQEDNVVLSIDQQKIDEAPSFSSEEWENFKKQEFREKIHGYYNNEESQEIESQDIQEQEEFIPLTPKESTEIKKEIVLSDLAI
jgi:sporulation protein YlmC with PRC-barrel domain